MNASWVISAASAGLCIRLMAMLYTYVCWLWTSVESASRSPACARRTSAGLGSAIRYSSPLRRTSSRISCAPPTVQQHATQRRLIGHETILHARPVRRLRRPRSDHRRKTCMGPELPPQPHPQPPPPPPAAPPPPPYSP